MGGRSSTACATQRRGQHAPCAYTRGHASGASKGMWHMPARVSLVRSRSCFRRGRVRIGSGSQETTTVRVEDWRCGVGRADERAHHAVCSAPPPAVASGIASAAATAPSVHPFIVPRPSLSSGITSPDKRPHRSRARSCSLPMKTCSPHAPWTSAMVNLHANGAILIAGDKNRPHAAPRHQVMPVECCCSTPLQHACDRHSIMGT